MSWLDWLKPSRAPESEAAALPAHDAFPEAFSRTVGEEGGYVNDSKDPGGETKFGISKRAHPDIDIAALTIDQARDIYRSDYWEPNRLGELPDRMAVAVFDGCVNSGSRAAIAWLQRALGAPDTGEMDDHTVGSARAATDPSGVLMRYWGHRLRFLADLSTWPAFGRGWSRRVARGLLS